MQYGTKFVVVVPVVVCNCRDSRTAAVKGSNFEQKRTDFNRVRCFAQNLISASKISAFAASLGWQELLNCRRALLWHRVVVLQDAL